MGFQSIECEALPRVARPARYTGAFLHAVPPRGGEDAARVTLLHAGLYEQGAADHALRVLYHLLARSGVTPELAFAPERDLERELRSRNAPLWGVLARRPVRDSDIVWVVIPSPLFSASALNLLDLAGLPLHAAERGDADPIVIASGDGVANPEPVAPFLDAVLVGDPEAVVEPLMARFAGKDRPGGRRCDRLEALAQTAGIYVPSLYAVGAEGRAPVPATVGAPSRVTPARVSRLLPEHHPERPILSLAEIPGDRLGIEVRRGCGGNCRGCCGDPTTTISSQVAPGRWREPGEVARLVEAGLRAGGWDEVELLALPTSDGARILAIVRALTDLLQERNALLHVPEVRPEALTGDLLAALARLPRTPLRLAPEADSAEATLDVLDRAAGLGWRSVHLALPVGTPGSEERDLESHLRLLQAVSSHLRRATGKRINVSASLHSFVARPHTAFQWSAQPSAESLAMLAGSLRARASAGRVRLRWDVAEAAHLSGVLARGDRTLAPVIEEAWRAGARHDAGSGEGWTSPWRDAFRAAGADRERWTRERPLEEALPWAHLQEEGEAAHLARAALSLRAGRGAPDCHLRQRADGPERVEMAAAPERSPTDAAETVRPAAPSPPSRPAPSRARIIRRNTASPVSSLRIRLAYSVGEELRFLSHLDLVRLFDRVFRRSAVPVAYTQGRAPRPRISFGPPRAVGMASRCEYVDFTVTRAFTDAERRRLAEAMPAGLSMLEARPLYGPRRSLEQEIDCAVYRISVFAGGRGSPAFSQDDSLRGSGRDALLARLEEMAARFEAQRDVPFRRVTPKKAETINLRDSLLAREWSPGAGGNLDLLLLVALGGRGRARPVEVAAGLMGLPSEDATLLRIDRLGLYRRGERGMFLSPYGDPVEMHATQVPSGAGGTDRGPERLEATAARGRRYGDH